MAIKLIVDHLGLGLGGADKLHKIRLEKGHSAQKGFHGNVFGAPVGTRFTALPKAIQDILQGSTRVEQGHGGRLLSESRGRKSGPNKDQGRSTKGGMGHLGRGRDCPKLEKIIT
jgi:hypothetical protein